ARKIYSWWKRIRSGNLQEKDLGRLHRMAARGDLAWLRRWRWWLKRVDIDRQDKEKRTPLHLACANGHADVVRFLVQENCQLNLADNFKRSPLMTAVQCQQEECVAILLECGADPNLADADGNTALHLAVLSANIAITELLLEHHASTDAQNKEGYTPLDLAVSEYPEKTEGLLQKKGADGHAQEQRESSLCDQLLRRCTKAASLLTRSPLLTGSHFIAWSDLNCGDPLVVVQGLPRAKAPPWLGTLAVGQGSHLPLPTTGGMEGHAVLHLAMAATRVRHQRHGNKGPKESVATTLKGLDPVVGGRGLSEELRSCLNSQVLRLTIKISEVLPSQHCI
uniref:Uncharacterized protein n=1 Tax=Otus sunia TaxID=257818 RepID=A0A8C8BG79_9STRI